jgi:hypothetical protein
MKTAGALAVAIGAVLATTAAAVPQPHVERARSGIVTAVFSYTYDPAAFRFGHRRLVIRRSGVTRFAAVLRRRLCAYCDIQPASYFDHRRSVSIRDLDGDRELEVVLELYWGGAHCCWYTQIYRYLPRARTYRPFTHVWGNPGHRLEDLDRDGRPEFVTGDDRFSYAFASFADSRWPIRILRYRRGGTEFVTRAYPRAIEADASRLWREAKARSRRADNDGILAAWVADECMLGRSREAFATLRRSSLVHGSERRAAYLRHLRRFLRRTGYL